MGTRGLYGITKNGIDKLTYNHYDSYPECLGKDIADFCISSGIDNLNKFYDLIEMVDNNSVPTDEQIEHCTSHGFDDMSVSTRSTNDWYCLTRNLQGNFMLYQQLISKNAKIYMTDDSDFIKDSLWCEYAYIINLDDNVLEFYIGYQNEPQESNRYGTEISYEGFDGAKFYPCKLVKTFQLADLDDANYIVDTMIQVCKSVYDDGF